MILDDIKTPDQITTNFQNRIVVATGHRPDKCGGFTTPAYLLLKQIAIDWSKNKSPETLNGLGLQGDSWQKRFASALVEETAGNWMQYFLNYDPEDNLKKLRVKVLALNGDKDNQVLSSSNLAGIESVLKRSKSPSYHIVSLPGLNHLFQTCKKCTVPEYGELEETFSPAAL